MHSFIKNVIVYNAVATFREIPAICFNVISFIAVVLLLLSHAVIMSMFL